MLQQLYTHLIKYRIWLSFVVIFLVSPIRLHAQIEVEIARRYVTANADQEKLTTADINELLVSSEYRSPTTGWYHVYFNQAYQSIEIYNRLMNVVLVDNQATYLNHNFIPA